MRNLFNSVRLTSRRRNKFNLSYPNDFDADYGQLIPVVVEEAQAGDIFKYHIESFIRSMPLRAPAFKSDDVSYHFFFVPNRLVYDEWSKFIVRGDNGNTDYDKPYVDLDTLTGSGSPRDPQFVTPGSLYDFLNFPTFNNSATAASDIANADLHTKVDMMPFNVYNLIYNEYYRDENLMPEVFMWTRSGMTDNYTDLQQYLSDITNDWSSNMALYVLPWIVRRRAWRKDYFTSALPFVQKGPQISLQSAVVPANGNSQVAVKFMLQNNVVGDPQNWFLSIRNSSYPNPSPTSWSLKASSQTSYPYPDQGVQEDIYPQHVHFPGSPLRDALAYIDLPELQSTIMTISDLRTGIALQQWFELNARTGSNRYFEYLLGHFGVRDRDSRLQRPEYLGGFTHAIQISDVEQTSSSDQVSPQGNLAGRGLGYAVNAPIKYRVPEHGWIMCIQSIRPKTPYYQGWPRKYQRWDAFDYYDPLFDHLSEQAIKVSEIYWTPTVQPFSSNDGDFGYTPRFSEYRSHLGELHGSFRDSLSYWVSPRRMVTAPHLSQSFIEVNGYNQNLYDAFAYPGSATSPAAHFVCHLVIHCSAIRQMSKYASPR